MVYGLWFEIQGLGFRVKGLGFMVQGLGFYLQSVAAENTRAHAASIAQAVTAAPLAAESRTLHLHSPERRGGRGVGGGECGVEERVRMRRRSRDLQLHRTARRSQQRCPQQSACAAAAAAPSSLPWLAGR